MELGLISIVKEILKLNVFCSQIHNFYISDYLQSLYFKLELCSLITMITEHYNQRVTDLLFIF